MVVFHSPNLFDFITFSLCVVDKQQLIFRRFCMVKETASYLHYVRLSLCLSIRLSAFIGEPPAGRISLKSDTSKFYEDMLNKIQIWLK